MPIYEYECQQCRHRVELIQKHSDAPLEQCPKCQGVMRKLMAAPAIQFKGSGWYITDYSDKGKSKTEGAAAETKQADGKPAKEAASTDAKPSSDKSAADKTADKKPETKSDKKSNPGGGSPSPPANSGGGGNS